MTKLRKQRRRKRYGYNVNRKRLRNKMRKTPVISCPQVKSAWIITESVKANLKNMGLAYDANIISSITSNKLLATESVTQLQKKELLWLYLKLLWPLENSRYVQFIPSSADFSDGIAKEKLIKTEHVKPSDKEPDKLQVITELEEDAHAPRERGFRLPNSQVQWVTYLMDKYGEDYEAMEHDKKNYYQETWQQIRRKIKQFKGIPEQYNEYLAKKEAATKTN